MKRILLALAVMCTSIIAVPGIARADECSFTGAVSSEWKDQDNWDCGRLPDSDDVVYVSTDVDSFACYTDFPFGPLICPTARKVIIESGASLTGPNLQAAELVIQGGTLSGLEYATIETVRLVSGTISDSEFRIGQLFLANGSILGSAVSATNVEWPGGTFAGSLNASSLTLKGSQDTIIADGVITAGSVIFSSVAADQDAPTLYLGNSEDQIALVSRRVRIDGDWVVEEYAGDTGWQVTEWAQIRNPDVTLQVTDLAFEVVDLGIAPQSAVRVSGGEFTPKMGSTQDSAKRSVLACTSLLSKACEGLAFDMAEAGRLETGVARPGGTSLRPTRVTLPEKWGLFRVIWAHSSGQVGRDKSWDPAYRSIVEPLGAGVATQALFELVGGSVDGVEFTGGGPAKRSTGVDVDILGNSEEPITFGDVTIGSDATLSAETTTFVDCGATFTIDTSGTMTHNPGSILAGCNDESMVRNKGTWIAPAGDGEAMLSETKFTSTGILDMTEQSLYVGDLYEARIQGTMLLSYNGYSPGALRPVDSTKVTLGAPNGDPLILSVAVPPSGQPGGGLPGDGDSMAVVDYETEPDVSGNVKVEPSIIRPGLYWTTAFGAGGLSLVARQGVTASARVMTNGQIPCPTNCLFDVTKNQPYAITWKVATTGSVPDMRATITLPASTKVVRTDNMQCTGRRALVCTIGSVGAASTLVTMRLRTSKVGKGAVTGVLAGQGLTGDLGMQQVNIRVR